MTKGLDVEEILNFPDHNVRMACDTGEFWRILVEQWRPDLVIERQDIHLEDYKLFLQGLEAEYSRHRSYYIMKTDGAVKLSEPILVFPSEKYPYETDRPYAAVRDKIFELDGPNAELHGYVDFDIEGLTPLPGSKGYVVRFGFAIGRGIDDPEFHELINVYITRADGDIAKLFKDMMLKLTDQIYHDFMGVIEHADTMNEFHREHDTSFIQIEGLSGMVPIRISMVEFRQNMNPLLGHMSTAVVDESNIGTEIKVYLGDRLGTYYELTINRVTF